MDPKELIEHAVISIVGWLIGMLLGWVASFTLTTLWRKSNLNVQKFYSLVFLVPWRTLILGLFLVNYIPLVPVRWFGLGNITNIFSVAYVVFWLTLVILFSSAPRETIQPILRFLPWARTLAVFSVMLTTHYGSWVTGGLGFGAEQYLLSMRYDSAWPYFWWMIAIAFAIDVAIAIGQIAVHHYSTPKNAG